MEIYNRLRQFPIPEAEWWHYCTNERINDRGVKIDTDLVQQAIACDLMLSEAMSKKAYELTGLENPNSVSQLKTWLEGRGIPMDTLGKKDVAQMIGELDKNGVDAEALDMLKLRLQMAKSSVKKYQAAERCVCPDGRARGMFQFYGASRTGRYSGRNIQLQNLPQNHISTLDEARELVKLGCFDMIETIYGNTPDVLSQLIRTMLIPEDGCEFIVADFSAIEARVLAWEAGEEWRLDAFKEGQDINCASASQMFHVPVVKHGVNGELSQKGKVAELACIAEGSLVLTDKGLIPIQDVTLDHRLWDGCEWVSHEGVIYKGGREVIEYEGLTATPDHLVWIAGEPGPVRFGFAAACGVHLLQTGDGGRAIRLGEDYQPGETVEQELELLLCVDGMPGMRKYPMAEQDESDKRCFQRMSELLTAEADTKVAGSEANSGKAEMRKSQRPGIPQLRRKGDQVCIFKCVGSGVISNPGIWNSGQGVGNRQDRQRRGLCSGESQVRNESRKYGEQENYGFEPIRSRVLAVCGNCCQKEIGSGPIAGTNHPGCGNSCVREKKELEVHRSKAGVYDIP